MSAPLLLMPPPLLPLSRLTPAIFDFAICCRCYATLVAACRRATIRRYATMLDAMPAMPQR